MNRVRECRGALNPEPINVGGAQWRLPGTAAVINKRLVIEKIALPNDRQAGQEG